MSPTNEDPTTERPQPDDKPIRIARIGEGRLRLPSPRDPKRFTVRKRLNIETGTPDQIKAGKRRLMHFSPHLYAAFLAADHAAQQLYGRLLRVTIHLDQSQQARLPSSKYPAGAILASITGQLRHAGILSTHVAIVIETGGTSAARNTIHAHGVIATDDAHPLAVASALRRGRAWRGDPNAVRIDSTGPDREPVDPLMWAGYCAKAFHRKLPEPFPDDTARRRRVAVTKPLQAEARDLYARLYAEQRAEGHAERIARSSAGDAWERERTFPTRPEVRTAALDKLKSDLLRHPTRKALEPA